MRLILVDWLIEVCYKFKFQKQRACRAFTDTFQRDMQQRAGPLMQADAFLRATFNGALLGADAYSTIKLLLVLLGVSRVLKDLRRASRCEGLYSWLMACISPWLKRLPFVQSQLKKETDKLRHDIQPSLIKDLTQPKTRLPAAGMAEDKVLKLMLERRELDTKYWQDGRVTGAIYHGKREYMDFVGIRSDGL
jgi:sphinganine-1-phosphate aldolase